MDPIVIDFDRIRANRAGTITVSGKRHTVKQMSAALLSYASASKDNDQLAAGMHIVARLVPTLSEDELSDISVEEMNCIISMANGDAEAVRKLDPNYEAPDPNGAGPSIDAQSSPA